MSRGSGRTLPKVPIAAAQGVTRPGGGDPVMLRAVDVQQVLLQTTSVERIQQTQQQQSDLQQRYVAMHSIEEKKLLKEKVKESDETEKARIQREEERERKRKMARDSSEERRKSSC
ncbi:MAG: hypothetical protein MZV70_75105 [Desulfobacterales bacterium]|nr:hypothetical protein [Desulfobacterales bacterium]